MYLSLSATNLFKRAANYVVSQKASLVQHAFVQKIFSSYASANGQIARFAQSSLVTNHSVALIAGGVILGALAIGKVWQKYAVFSQLANERIADLLQLVDKLQTEYQTILQTHGRVEKLQAQVRELEEGKSTLESQLESSTGVLISLEKLLNESRNRVEVLERENVGLTQDKEKLEKADLEAKGQVSSLIDRMQALQDQLSVLLSQKQSELAVYEDEISVLRGNVSRLEKENTQYQQQNLKFLEQARIFGEIIIKKLPKLGALVYEVSGNPFSPETQRGLESDYSTGTPSTQDRLKIVMAALVTETPPTELDSVRRRLFQSPAK